MGKRAVGVSMTAAGSRCNVGVRDLGKEHAMLTLRRKPKTFNPTYPRHGLRIIGPHVHVEEGVVVDCFVTDCPKGGASEANTRS